MAKGLDTRSLLLEAALRVVAREGIRSVTHRKVAQEAGVSLSATSYHFSSIDAILLEAMRHYVTSAISRYGETFDDLHSEDEFCAAVLQIVLEVQRDSIDAILLYELYAQAARDSNYRELVMDWSSNTVTRFSAYYPDDVVVKVAALLDGFLFLRSISHATATPDLILESLKQMVSGRELQSWNASAAAMRA